MGNAKSLTFMIRENGNSRHVYPLVPISRCRRVDLHLPFRRIAPFDLTVELQRCPVYFAGVRR
jgi:hypothetical protein